MTPKLGMKEETTIKMEIASNETVHSLLLQGHKALSEATSISVAFSKMLRRILTGQYFILML